jgi:dipeptidyl aminopeptidase/acylaminoacyl peptidase
VYRLNTLALAHACLLFTAQEAPHPFGVHDLLAMDRISDHQVSPDGTQVAFTVRSTDLEANRGRTDIWAVGVDGSNARRLTTHEASDHTPRWDPDGRSLLFLSSRGGSSQVWRLDLEGGEPQQLTDFPLDVSSLAVFADGERLALTLEVWPQAESLAASASIDAEKVESEVEARVFDSLLFRHWDHWEDGKRSHVFVWTIGTDEPVDLMRGLDVDCPTQPFGGGEEIRVAPDGSEVVFAAKNVGASAAWSTDVDLWAAPSDGSAPARCLTEANEAYDNAPSFSPDGHWLAYLAMKRPGYESDRLRIVLLDRKTGSRRVLTEAWDRSSDGVSWSADGKTIYTSATNVGNKSLFAVDVASGEVRTLLDQGWNSGPVQAADRVVFAQDTLAAPAELFSMARDGSDVRAITRVNARQLAACKMGTYEQFSFKGAKGETVYGWVVRPVGFDVESFDPSTIDYRDPSGSGRYPIAYLIHGGPQGSFGNHFHYRWNPQVYAGAGYAAVMVDFHGSTGYGQAFTDSINGDWGGAPYEDLMHGIDEVTSINLWMDHSRTAALGASYGGYMINWLAGRTNLFRCMVNHDGLFDLRSMYFETEELWFPEWDLGGPPWKNPEGYSEFNPAENAQHWATPMLVIHGGRDFRVPESQGFSTFTALQRRGIPSKLLYFPAENHWVLKPRNSIVWHETVLDWIGEWTRPGQ